MSISLERALQSFLKIGEGLGKAKIAKVVELLKEHFLSSAFQVAEAYQSSYVATLEGIQRALSPAKVDLRSKRKKQFSIQVRDFYLLSFAEEKKLTDEALEAFKQQVIAHCELLLKYKENLFEANSNPLNEQELAELLTASNLPNLTQLVIERLTALKIKFADDQVLAFFRFHDLLGRGIEFFLRNNKAIENRLLALQTAGAWDANEALKETIKTLQQAGIQPEIQPEDEFKNHDSESIKRVAQAIGLLKRTPFNPQERGQALLMAATALFSLGSLDEAKNELEEALQLANNEDELALVHFNLFQVYLRYSTPQYNEIAFYHLQTALELDNKHTFYFYDFRKYKLLKLLGAGGMGCAFLAEDLSLERQVVLKSFWKTFEYETREVFKEALAMRKIAREYVPETYGVEFYGKHAYLLMEYIADALDGETWLREKGKLNTELAVTVATKFAQGLQAAHKEGVLHLDLKPANLLLKSTETDITVKIIDFGLAKIATPLQQQARRSQKQSTQFGLRLAGTWDYSPPEQRGDVRYGKPSVKSDVFTFGKTMLRLCSGKEPANCREKDLPGMLREVLFDCIEENPEKRPTIALIMQKLEEKPVPIPPPPPFPPIPPSQPIIESKPSNFPVWALVIVAVIGVGIWVNEKNKEIPPQSTSGLAAAQKAKEEAERKTREAEEKARIAQQETEKIRAEQAAAQKAKEAEVARQAEIERQKREQAAKKQAFEPEMVKIPAGYFMMGSNDYDSEKPVHKVDVGGFYMSKYETTRGQFAAFVADSGYKTEAEKGDGCYGWTGSTWDKKPEFNWKNLGFAQTDTHPVACVSWNDAVAYSNWLSKQTGKTYRLPTEAEWEYAARAGSDKKYSFGDSEVDLENYAWYNKNSNNRTHPVGEKKANQFDLYDMAGNVWEWTCSDYTSSYDGNETKCSNSSNNKSLRGGSWNYVADSCHAAGRSNNTPSNGINNIGFRLILFSR